MSVTHFTLGLSPRLHLTAGGQGGTGGRKCVFPVGGSVGGTEGEEGSIAGLVLERPPT